MDHTQGLLVLCEVVLNPSHTATSLLAQRQSLSELEALAD